MIISDARGGHVSPGIYTEEKDVTYSVKSLGITNVALAGETIKGPAFETISISDWKEFRDYFGGTSTEKFKDSNYPKYELPYAAKEYLKQSKRLEVVRVLGLSGYKTSTGYVVALDLDGKTYPVAVLRSKGDYKGLESEDPCVEGKYEIFNPYVRSFELRPYTGSSFNADCVEIYSSASTYCLEGVVSGDTDGSNIMVDNSGNTMGKFAIAITYKTPSMTEEAEVVYNVSLNPFDRDYIYNVFTSDPLTGNAILFIESVFDKALNDLIQRAEIGKSVEFKAVEDNTCSDFLEPFRCAETPWVVSEVLAAGQDNISVKKLFKFLTVSDGNSANYQVKISIQNIRPDEGTFDVLVRDFYDEDNSPYILEKFSKCSMQEGSSNYIGLKIGTYDGAYISKSKFITVMVNEEEGIESCVPAGYLGYPIPTYGCDEKIELAYNTLLNNSVKPKRQYFGLNSDILDEDILNYKGLCAYADAIGDAEPELLTNGFHLDAILSEDVRKDSVLSGADITVDNVPGFKFTTVDAYQSSNYTKIPRILTESFMEGTIYEDINTRKFTLYPYGGFDGWDIYRGERTTSDFYKSTKYAYVEGCPFKPATEGYKNLNTTLELHLPTNAITSDYYAYLGAYRQFANPQETDIDIFATPGIDWVNNTLLFEDALDVVEDSEDGRGGDCLYVVTTPQYDKNKNDYTEEELVSMLEDLEISSSYACTFYPWVKYFDNDSKVYVNLPATKDVIRNFAMTDNISYSWYASAGIERGDVNCVKAYKKCTLADEDTLIEGMINPLKSFAQDGVKIWGNKTMYRKDSPLNRINVRRLMIRLKKLIVNASKHLIFEQYDETLEKQFRALIDPILMNIKSNRGIYDYRIEVECNEETRDQHILPAKILIKPTPSLEYISLSFVVYPESVSFDE